MSARDCINRAVESGRIPRDRARQLTDMLDGFEREFQATLGPEAGARQAELALAEKVARDAARKRDLVARQLITQARVKKYMAEHPLGPAAAARALLTFDQHVPHWINVQKQMEAIQVEAQNRITAGLIRFRPTVTGRFRDRAGQANVVRALLGEKTGDDAANELAVGVAEAFEYLRARANAAGADIAKRADWKLPNPRWDVRRINDTTYETFRATLWDKLDRARMIDYETGAPMSDMTLEQILRDAYETLHTDGINKLNPGSMANRRMKARQWDERHRVFVFKDADAWLAVQEALGHGDPWDVITGHIDKMASDIAWMEVMGPNPEATRKFIQETVDREVALVQGPGARKMRNAARSKMKRFHSEWDEMTGLLSTPNNDKIAAIGSTTRNYLAATLLGRAFLSSVSDFGTMQLTARFNGLSQAAMLKNYVRLWVSPAAREEAIQAGLLAEAYGSAISHQVRYTGQLLSDDWSSRLANFTMTASLLKPHTQFAQWAFQQEFLGAMARMSDKAWDDLPPRLRGAMARYGMRPEDWGVVRQAVRQDGGRRKLSIIDMARVAGPRAVEAAAIVNRMVHTERDMAVIVPNARTRSTGLFGGSQGTQAGTPLGELVRSTGMFKSFPITVLSNHMTRMMLQTGVRGKLSYGATFFGLAAMYGMVAMQSKQVTAGKDALDMNRWDTWFAAIMQGGGLGIWGDFLFRSENRFGQGMAVTFTGPVFGLGSDLKKATWDNAMALGAGENTSFGKDMVGLIGRYGFAPGNLWYTRLAFERAVIDQLAVMADPQAHRRFQRLEQEAHRERGQDFWWRPGKTTPDRAPRISTMVE